jgi:hypothetical protein
VREVDADLMFATGARDNAEQGKGREPRVESRKRNCSGKSAFDEKFCLRLRAVGSHAIFHDNAAMFILAERRVNQATIFAHVAVDNCQIFFFDGAAFENFSEFAGGFRIFCNQNDAAGLAVEAVD